MIELWRAPISPNPLSSERLAAALTPFQIDAHAAEVAIARHARAHDWPKLPPGDRVTVFAHSAGNIFMQEIAELLTPGLAAAGYEARLVDERAALKLDDHGDAIDDTTTRFIVAPHEFF